MCYKVSTSYVGLDWVKEAKYRLLRDVNVYILQ